MRRAPIVLTATAAGLAAVLSFKPHEPALPSAAASAATPAATATTPAGAGASPSGSSGSSGTRTATGDVVPTQYGNAQVRVTVTDGKITKIEPLQLQGNDPKSVAISSYAEPLLRQSALAKQSAAIDTVSGATFTSASYEASLQSALDKLGFKAADGSRASTSMPDIQDHHGGPFGR
ncbi:FMN-binding protein [Candidatus Solirubrobacter pratensis]|uniref:FMN-binding protein n=1 Tax=Candidatus Solirubrobacter pratensis TaxID=1298857 RepID=UPI00041852EC|nr:FMN-binding protein [Candidatus Solirubrobacter pratensis]